MNLLRLVMPLGFWAVLLRERGMVMVIMCVCDEDVCICCFGVDVYTLLRWISCVVLKDEVDFAKKKTTKVSGIKKGTLRDIAFVVFSLTPKILTERHFLVALIFFKLGDRVGRTL